MGKVDDAVSGWLAGAPAPKATVEKLLTRLTKPAVAVAAWRDLVYDCQTGGIAADGLGSRRDLFRSLLSIAQVSLRTTGRTWLTCSTTALPS
ncbi:hypothetical protein ACSNOB_10925 [Micromonospora sp. URMC 106]|uniref:hypothetical protein n=1 Tax=Micromonospora sp. URMC 106 TaxID=3423408 RepID=UPI003F1D3C26